MLETYHITGGTVSETGLPYPVVRLSVIYRDWPWTVTYFQVPEGWEVVVARWDGRMYGRRGAITRPDILISDAISHALDKFSL